MWTIQNEAYKGFIVCLLHGDWFVVVDCVLRTCSRLLGTS